MADSIVDEIAKVIARHYDYEALHRAFPTEEKFDNWIETWTIRSSLRRYDIGKVKQRRYVKVEIEEEDNERI